jgi:hypothetical protein
MSQYSPRRGPGPAQDADRYSQPYPSSQISNRVSGSSMFPPNVSANAVASNANPQQRFASSSQYPPTAAAAAAVRGGPAPMSAGPGAGTGAAQGYRGRDQLAAPVQQKSFPAQIPLQSPYQPQRAYDGPGPGSAPGPGPGPGPAGAHGHLQGPAQGRGAVPSVLPDVARIVQSFQTAVTPASTYGPGGRAVSSTSTSYRSQQNHLRASRSRSRSTGKSRDRDRTKEKESRGRTVTVTKSSARGGRTSRRSSSRHVQIIFHPKPMPSNQLHLNG